MRMKFWRLSVRSKVLSSLLLLAAGILLAIGSACQHAQLAPYRAYANDADVPRIELQDAKRDYDSGSAVIVDSRPEQQYTMEHIAGAINVPAGSSDTEFDKIPKGKKIIVYCS